MDDSGLNDFNDRLPASASRTGELFLSHKKINGRLCLRKAIGNLRTEERRAHDARVLPQHGLRKMLRPCEREISTGMDGAANAQETTVWAGEGRAM